MPVPTAFIFSGKAAQSYTFAKEVIRLINAVADVVKAAGDSAQQAAGEIAAALAAVSTVKTDSDSAAAGALFENVVAAASAAGSDKAESLSLAKIAAAAGALVLGRTVPEALALAADYTAECIRLTLEEENHSWYGVNFEQATPYLLERMKK